MVPAETQLGQYRPSVIPESSECVPQGVKWEPQGSFNQHDSCIPALHFHLTKYEALRVEEADPRPSVYRSAPLPTGAPIGQEK